MAIFHGNSIPAGGSASYYDYEINNSLRFNNDDIPQLTDSSQQPTSPYTVSVWVKRGDLGRRNIIWAANAADHLEFKSDDTLKWQRRPTTVTSTQIFRDTSAWYHIVCKSESGAMYLYVNNTLVASNGSSTANPYTAGEFRVGSNSPSASATSATCFDGYMAEFHWIHGTALNPDSFGETGDYGEWKPIQYTGSHGTNGWHLDFANPNPLKSLSGNGNVVHSTSAYKFGSSSIAFDGNTDYIQTPDSDDFSFGTGDMSFSCWARFNNFTNAQGHLFISHWNPGSNKAFRCMYSGGALKMDVHIGSEIQVVNQSWSASVDTWYHIRFNRTAGQFNVFVDGVKQGTGSTNTGNVTNSSGNITIGSDGHSFTFSDMDGFLDDIEFTTSNQNGTSNFDKPTEYSTTTSSTKLLIQSNSSSNNSSTFVDSSGVAGGTGHDSSGNGNHFTPTNITTSDQVKDSPTNNFCTMNPLDNYYAGSTFSQGNLGLFITGSAQPTNTATFGMNSGKWYWEVRQGVSGAGGGGLSYVGYLGIAGSLGDSSSSQLGEHYDQYSLYAYSGQQIRNNNSWNSYGTVVTYTNGDIISMALDLDNNKMYWAKNGSYLNSGDPAGNSNGYSVLAPSATSLGAYFPAAGDGHSSSENFMFNFGQEGTFAGNVTAGGNSDDNGIGNFKYAPPAGFLSLCTANLPEPTVIPSEHFTPVIYTGTGATKSVTGVGFQPDLVWMKSRSNSYNHQQHDAVRGANKQLRANDTQAEQSLSGTLTSFDSDGFSLGSDTNTWEVNKSGSTYVAWNWKTGTTTSGTTSGVGTGKAYSASYNASAGFSIVSYLGNGSVGHTIPHHLGVAPELMIMTGRAGTDGWYVYSSPMGNTKGMQLNAQNAPNTTSAYWNNTSPTSSVWTVSNNSGNNSSDAAYIAYCFSSIEGYSKIGQYEGNGNVDGTFVYTGFKPAFVICKKIDATGGWIMHDNARNPSNLAKYGLLANTSAAETSSDNQIDLLSNGFKRRATDGHGNATNSYMYYAVAELPFKHSNAR